MGNINTETAGDTSGLFMPDNIATATATYMSPAVEEVFSDDDADIDVFSRNGGNWRMEEDDENIHEPTVFTEAEAILGSSAKKRKAQTIPKNPAPPKGKKGLLSKSRNSTRASQASKSANKGGKPEAESNLVQDFLQGGLFDHVANSKGRDELPTFQGTNRRNVMQELRKHIPKASKKELEQFNKCFVHLKQRCHPDGNGRWKINGMTSRLDHYQVAGLAEMRRRELGKDKPLGGLLADEMGLGKTLMAIGLILFLLFQCPRAN